MATKAPQPAAYERSDVCAVPAASVIVENVVAFEIAAAVVEKYVGTSLAAIKAAHEAFHELGRKHLDEWGRPERMTLHCASVTIPATVACSAPGSGPERSRAQPLRPVPSHAIHPFQLSQSWLVRRGRTSARLMRSAGRSVLTAGPD